jgi:hypothetical protein
MTFAAAGIVVAGIAALAVVPLIGFITEASAAPEQTAASSAAPTITNSAPDVTAAYAEGGALYDAYVLEGRLLLPPGYVWPAGAERDVIPEEAQRYAWFDWIAAHADAALSGDWQAATDLRTHIPDVPLEGERKADVRGLAQGGDENYELLLEMFPLQDGMKIGSFRVDLGPREHANGSAEVTAGGLMTSYTVAPGDSLYAIAKRFSVRLYDLNRSVGSTIHPGDVIRLQ